MTRHDKTALRHRLRQQRQQLSQTYRQQAGVEAVQHLQGIPGWQQLHHIALYFASNAEMPTAAIAQHCRQAGKTLYLPRIESTTVMHFHRWQDQQTLIENRFGIAEPAADAHTCLVEQLDLVVLPLVGWDRNGGRLGMGGGFYDRALAGHSRPFKLGLAYACQELEKLPVEPWDVSLDGVLTEKGLWLCQK